MPFYMVLNGQTNAHHFDYLSHDPNPRLDKTLAHGDQKKPIEHHANKRLFALEIMSRNVFTLKPSDSLEKAMQLLQKHRIHHIPILNDQEKLVGQLSDRDLLKVEDNKLFSLIAIQDIMSHIVVACTYDTDARDLSRVLVREQISALPVLDDDLKLNGIVSRVDVLKAVVDGKFQY
ncbi:MAG: hypothetical protein COW00_11525 [Bdellovibrio sp. CG12_big_fil_rev_8_21_14_0_65_39_13]|nr:MAG: hypothetical protein COW78_04795 [Bdellovibrio sp. CG22_combo_CG10-13_8_21_14_all_39_27]PIQ59352.1 MAG: hypothetical protein COW00_11525 [Bdellovibrio sp. CG12_big_fil_rev_8_21_14_0_65_39_13]PIR32773.1 MAG: hypothetical protein COV37_18780 [Bdellovibrio sp. CG11_big_fil_rev_8_21_14_0_20_39_38]PJB52304.1 MAG: hypothetical protein CO099_13400 [Bdellovibrio sp. CG_4_9_14_3_um_filter_39_7]